METRLVRGADSGNRVYTSYNEDKSPGKASTSRENPQPVAKRTKTAGGKCH